MDNPNRPPDSYLFSVRYLVLVNLMTCGIELCTSAAFGYLPPLLLEEGISETRMSVIIASGPMIALFLLPMMGTMSDNCTSPYGRRRPFLAGLAVITVISMMMLAFPQGEGWSVNFFVSSDRAKFFMLAIGIIAFDLSTQVSFTPMESLLSDPCRTDEHHNKSFVVFTFLLSIGACVGYCIISVDWGATALGVLLGGQRKCIFLMLSVIFIIFTWISLATAYDPQMTRTKPMDADEHASHKTTDNLQHSRAKDHGKVHIDQEDHISKSGHHQQDTNGIIPHTVVLIPSSNEEVLTPKTFLPSFSILTSVSRLLNCFKFLCPRKCSAMLVSMMETIGDTWTSLMTMPKVLQKLWLANLLSNTAVIGFRLYFTDYVGETLYRGSPDSLEGSDERTLYDIGIRMGSWGLFLHSFTSGIMSIFFERTVSYVGERGVFLYGMLLFTVLTGLMLFVADISLTILLAAGTGIGTAITSTVPYTLLSGYHENSHRFFSDLEPQYSHLHGKGADFSLLDSGVILSEIISSLFFGVLVEYTATTVTYILCAVMFGILSCVSIWFIEYPAPNKGLAA